MQPVEPQTGSQPLWTPHAAAPPAPSRRPTGLRAPARRVSRRRSSCLAPPGGPRAAWRASCRRPSIPLAGARRAPPQHAPPRYPASPKPQVPGFGLRALRSGLWAPRSRQTCVAERTLARNLFCRTDAKPLLEAPCRPFCKTSDHKAAKMQQKFSPGRAGLPDWARPAEMHFATTGGTARPRGALLPLEARRVRADTCGGARRSISQQNAAGARHNMQVFTFFGLKRK